MHFFIDFDGPILDVSDKFYLNYSDILKQDSYPVLDKFLYWELKRNKTPEKTIHSLTNATVANFAERRKQSIETDAYQQYDNLQPMVIDVLKELKSKGKLYLVTLRHSHQQVLNQLNRFGITSYFDTILSSGEEISPKWKIKYNLLDHHFGGKIPENSIFIGDTETDILAGKQIGSKTIAVLNGMRNFEQTQLLAPDYIIPSIGGVFQLNL